ncbi:MAG: UvrD-helicase domain-containing protein [Cephaloticoccus sp.]|nr:UvrD-helicase domain-containing protein [Cephaloticoccus sp.]MCF7761256.1 UvrD-helicase domain-containing protein [Cephaloticoccus sp.]
MSESLLVDHAQRERFRLEWDRNFAVSANAGSGKTTAISERLAALALRTDGGDLLRKTAVVTFTKKAANQIGQRARGVLMQQLVVAGRSDLTPLDQLERTFFGTIHSFCLKLAQTYGQDLGVNLNPTVLTEEEEAAFWEEFLEEDAMNFTTVPADAMAAFLRHVPLTSVFDLAREMDAATARRFRAKMPGLPAGPDEGVLAEILAVQPKQKRSLAAVQANQQLAQEWCRRYRAEELFLPLPQPQGTAAGIAELFARMMAPLKSWLAAVAAVLAAELAERFRAWRDDRGVQTYADQIDAALDVLREPATLDRIRQEGWRIILDEAQDTDPQQFAVLVEVARPPGAEFGTWPGPGLGPRTGHFCMVGDGQQSIYGSRADVTNFMRHLDAFAQGDGGELLKFQVTFRASRTSIALLNATLPKTFGTDRIFNLGLPPAEGAPAPRLQVPYEPLVAGPKNVAGLVGRIPLILPEPPPQGVEAWLAEEVRQIAAYLSAHGPAGVGAGNWGDICLLAPRNDWLLTARKELEAAGLKVALQMRKNRNGDIPVYAWMTGLLAAVCDPENTYEWVGVLREVFVVSDALIATELRSKGCFNWEEPEDHPEPLRNALVQLRPFVLQANDEGVALEKFTSELTTACQLRLKACAIDPNGGMEAELDRLLAQAATLGLNGAGPRDWLSALLAELEAGRPAGKPAADALNLLTAYSAKGLEWPVVIPIGLWRACEKAPEQGLRVVRDQTFGPRVYFDNDSLPAEAKEARERERLRELVRLLYVTLTRPREALVLPWGEGFGGKSRGESFASLWGTHLNELGVLEPAEIAFDPMQDDGHGKVVRELKTEEIGQSDLPPLPLRILPHQLAQHKDLPRGLRHESGAEESVPVKPGMDPVDYGLWWHDTMEFMPWAGAAAAIDAHGRHALAQATRQGFPERGELEWELLKQSSAWMELHNPRWVCSAELSVFAPLTPAEWIDGVMDLVLHDPVARLVWVVDWKTNRKIPGETDRDHLLRLKVEYAPQLNAYGRCLQILFPDCRVQKWIYASVTANWTEVTEQ